MGKTNLNSTMEKKFMPKRLVRKNALNEHVMCKIITISILFPHGLTFDESGKS